MDFNALIQMKELSDGEVFCFTLPADDSNSLYDAVDCIRSGRHTRLNTDSAEIDIELNDIIPLHNVGGMQSLPRIREMMRKIGTGQDILEPDGLPNIKLVRVHGGKIVLFDGHHTTLAYMASGRKMLHEIPHLLICRENGLAVPDRYLNVFYGEHGQALSPDAWKTAVINWQAPKQKQLERRTQQKLGELFKEIQDKL
ncbi:MAG: hypothetical protein ABIG66_01870 [Candidatus Kerfeldbacteria bacterium]